jgi:hypothetical protein
VPRALPIDIGEVGLADLGGQRVIAPGAGQMDLAVSSYARDILQGKEKK